MDLAADIRSIGRFELEPESRDQQGSVIWRIRVALFAAFGLVLVWQVVSRSFVAYLADLAPESALSLRADDPDALLNLAARELNSREPAHMNELADSGSEDRKGEEQVADEEARIQGWAGLASKLPSTPSQPAAPLPEAQSYDQVRKWTETALASDPLNARGFRILGQISYGASNEEQTSKLMQAAARRSLRESEAVYWVMQKKYEERDYRGALQYADALLRSRQQLTPYVVPLLAQIAEGRLGNDDLKALLAANPPWRGQFFSALPRSLTDARTPLDLLFSIRDTPHPPTTAELRSYISFLIGRKLYELAFYTWLQFLPTEQLIVAGSLFNGSFEFAPSGLPFDWTITSGSGVTVDIAPKPLQGSEHALLIEFGYGRVEFRGVAQLLVLPPGTYQLTGSYMGQIAGKRGLVWRIACVEGGHSRIGASRMFIGAEPEWNRFEFSFTVPDQNCPAQQLRLELDARSASEQLVSGSFWYDDLRITKVSEGRDGND